MILLFSAVVVSVAGFLILQGFLFQFVVMLALLRELRSEFRQRIPFVLLPLQQSAVDRGVDAVGEFSDRILTRAIDTNNFLYLETVECE